MCILIKRQRSMHRGQLHHIVSGSLNRLSAKYLNINRKSYVARKTQPSACCSDDRKCPKSSCFGTFRFLSSTAFTRNQGSITAETDASISINFCQAIRTRQGLRIWTKFAMYDCLVLTYGTTDAGSRVKLCTRKLSFATPSRLHIKHLFKLL